MVRVVDKSTGEVIRLEYASYEEFAEKYDNLTQQIALLEKLKKKMATELKLMLGNETELPLQNGWYFKKSTAFRKNYDTEILRQYFDDAELLTTVTMIDDPKTDEPKEVNIFNPNKVAIDALLREHLEDRGRWSVASSDLSRNMKIESATETLRLIKGA